MKKLILSILITVGLAAIVRGGACGIITSGPDGRLVQECPLGTHNSCNVLGECAE